MPRFIMRCSIKFFLIPLAFIILVLLYARALADPAFLPEGIVLAGVKLKFYAVFILLAAFSGTAFFRWIWGRVSKRRLDFSALFLYMVIPGLIGARLYHLLTDWPLYRADPVSALYIWNGGLGIYGAILGGLIGLFVFARKKSLPYWILADLIVLALPLAQAIGRFGNLFNRELAGGVTNLPWGMSLSGFTEKFHPAFLYEQVLNLLLFFTLLILAALRKIKPGRGQIVAVYLIGYGIIRFVVDFFRLEPRIIFGVFTVAQLVSLCLALLGAGFLVFRNFLKR